VSEHEKCTRQEMFGQFIREIAVLTMVFVPLEAYKGSHLNWWQLTLAILLTVAAAVGMLLWGIEVERRRP
jgi:hypothetical protein